MSFHSGQTFTFGETPSATKWNYLWENDYALADGTGISDGVIGNRQLALGVCVQLAYTENVTKQTGTTLIPYDDTIPQNTEGDQYMSVSITPKATTNILVIDILAMMYHSATTGNIAGAIFQNSTANALAAFSAAEAYGGNSGGNAYRARHIMVAGTTSATTFKFRAGGQIAGTTTFNGIGGSRYFGGVLASSITVSEFKAS